MSDKVIAVVAAVSILLYELLLPSKVRAKIGIAQYIFLLLVIVIGGIYGVYQVINNDSYFFVMVLGFFMAGIIVLYCLGKGADKVIDYASDEMVSEKVRRRRGALIGWIMVIVGVTFFVWIAKIFSM